MRRLLIGAVVAAGVFAAGSATAQAHHDQACIPAVPGPVCITGLQHVVPETQAATWAAFETAFQPVAEALAGPYEDLDAIPEPFCVTVLSPICVFGLREHAKAVYGVTYFLAVIPLRIAVCTAVGPPECHLRLPPV